MATVHHDSWLNFSQHRLWEDFASLAIGVLVLIAPMFIAETHPDAVHISASVAAILICALALLEMVALRLWEEYLEVLCGAWLIAAPYAIGYEGMLATFHMAAGALVVLLALLELWQDYGRKIES